MKPILIISLLLLTACHSDRNKEAFEALEQGAYKEGHTHE